MAKQGKYVDGFVLVVPKKNVAAYKKMAAGGAKMWMKAGALEYKECMVEDLHPNMGGMQMPGFAKLAGLKKGETVWFSYIEYKSRAHRDAVNKKVMAQMAKEMKGHENDPMPFDMKRFATGGFKVEVGA